MGETTLSEVFVYRIPPNRNGEIPPDGIIGGKLTITTKVVGIFQASFNGEVGRSLPAQPIHLKFQGKDRSHILRDPLVQYVQSEISTDRAILVRRLAHRLSTIIDNRTKDLLFTFAFGKNEISGRIAVWAYPHDTPIQLSSNEGIPEVTEIENAFSKSSRLRKAVFLDFPLSVTRTDLVSGFIIDAAAGKAKVESNYWLSTFINGTTELTPTIGTGQIVKALKVSQEKSKSPEEKSSIVAVVHSFLAQARKDTTIKEISECLVGEAKVAFLAKFQDREDMESRFAIDFDLIKSKVKKSIISLKNGMIIHVPLSDEMDGGQYIKEEDGKKYFSIRSEVDFENYSL